MTLSREQLLAKAQIEEIVACSSGALELLDEPFETDTGLLKIHLSVATRAYRRAGGLPFRDRERLILYVPTDFPFFPPSLFFTHRRFAGTPHVQWGRHICLYQAVETEWQPADGMYGFMDRVEDWLIAAGADELDPDDAPLHPPAVYGNSKVSVVVRVDAPESEALWIGRADLKRISDYRRDLVRWAPLADWDEIPVEGSPAVAIMLANPMPFEYPDGVSALLDSLEQAGAPFGLVWSTLRLAAALTPAGQPCYIVLGAPMRRRAADEPLRQHLTIWEIASDDVQKVREYVPGGENEAENRHAVAAWMVEAKVGWCHVLEDRPEIVNRRDQGTTAAGVAGKAIALLGCGALGSALAEMLVRAGAAKLLLFDKSIVKPGLLVRQRFTDTHIGWNKAKALKQRLDGLGQGSEIRIETSDLRNGIIDKLASFEPDLIIDATASRVVAHRLETELKPGALACPLIMVAVSGGAEHGSVAVRMPDYHGGPIALERAAKLTAFRQYRTHPLVETFWPDKAVGMILPEPGCSSPTFIGSAADIDHHASGLLNIGLERATTLGGDRASMDLCASIWAPLGEALQRRLFLELGSPAAVVERNRSFRVLTSEVAERAMQAELRRIARTRSSRVETGGLIFGEIDESHQTIWIDGLSGPPPDSEMSERQFLCGTAGTVALASRQRAASGGSSRFVGIWHTHPISRGKPSEEDMAAMAGLLLLQQNPPRHVVMVIVGFAATRPQPNHFLFHREDFRLVPMEPPNAELDPGVSNG